MRNGFGRLNPNQAGNPRKRFRWLHLKNYKIEHKLLLTYPMLILISILVVSTFAVYFSKQHLKQRSITYAESVLQQISFNIDSQLERIDKDSYLFFYNSDVNAFFNFRDDKEGQAYNLLRQRIREFLINFLLTHPDLESIYLISNHDDVVTTVDSFRLEPLNDIRNQSAVGDGKIVWLNAKMSGMGNRIVPFVRDINDLSTLETNGVLLMYYRVSAINKWLEAHDIAVRGTMAVLDRDGWVVTSDDPEEIGSTIGSQIRERMNRSAGDFFVQEKKGNVFYVYYKSEFTNWTYLYRIPEEELFQGINRVRNLVLAVAALFGILSVVLARVIAYNISRPINRVIKEMKNVERNDLLVNLHYDGTDELSFLSASFNRMMDRLREGMRTESELQRMRHELEMRALQAEINPHFLYNTLDAINWIGRMNRIPEICEMTTMLADIMRYSISYRRDLVTVEKEFEHMQKYIGIQQHRYRDRLSVFYEMPEEALQVPIPKLTLQPIVENAIIHGLENKAGMGRLRVVGQRDGQRFLIKIEDNGCGIPEERLRSLLTVDSSRPNSIGLYNVNKRLKLFFGDGYGLEIESVAGRGTRVIILLPWIKGAVNHVQSADR
jgi:two-component system sensor histidine kinase YesM